MKLRLTQPSTRSIAISFVVSVLRACILALALAAIPVASHATPWSSATEPYGSADMGVDSKGNVFAAGSTEGPTVTSETLAYNLASAGKTPPYVDWVGTYTGYNATREYAVAPDGSGGCVSVGNTYVNNSPSPYQVALIVHYTSSGSSYSYLLNGSVNSSSAEATDVAVDNSGNIYVTGYIQDATTNQDIFVARFSSALALQWEKTWDDGSDGSDQGIGIAVDNAGGIYVSGSKPTTYAVNGSPLTGVLIKYATNGSKVWQCYTKGTGGKTIVPTQNYIYVGNGTISQYNASNPSAENWDTQLANSDSPYATEHFYGIAVDASGYIFGVDYGDSNEIVLASLDSSSGEFDSLATYSGYVSGNALGRQIAIDTKSNLYLAGYDTNDTEMVAIKCPYVASGGVATLGSASQCTTLAPSATLTH